MAEQFKTHYVSLDMYKTSSNEFEVVEGDTANLIVITLTDRGNPVDLTDCKVVVVFVRAGTPVEQDSDGHGVTISGEHNNIITVDLYATSYAYGRNTAEVQVWSGANFDRLATSAWFNFKGRRARTNEATLLSVPQWPILSGMINMLNGIIRGVQAKWSTTNINDPSYIQDKPMIGTDLQAATQQLTAETELIADTAKVAVYDTTHKSITWAQVKEWLSNAFASVFAPLSHASRHAAGATDATVSRFSVPVTDTWDGSSAPYTQVVNVTGVTAGMIGKIDIVLNSADATDTQVAQRNAWRLVDRADTGAGIVTLTCLESKPNVSFLLQMEVAL